MIRYIFAFLIVNSFSGRFVYPAPTVPKLLTGLLKECNEVPAIKTLISSRILECSDPNISEAKHFECVLFYDINKQLCNAGSNLVLNENSSLVINKPIDLKEFCIAAINFTASPVANDANYKITAEKLFHDPIACARICGVSEFLSNDVNYFCKYYKWGMDLLHNQRSAPNQLSSELDIIVPPPITDDASRHPPISVPSNSPAEIQNPIQRETSVQNPEVSPTEPEKKNEKPVALSQPVVVKQEEQSLAPVVPLSPVVPLAPVVPEPKLKDTPSPPNPQNMQEQQSEIVKPQAENEVHKDTQTQQQMPNSNVDTINMAADKPVLKDDSSIVVPKPSLTDTQFTDQGNEDTQIAGNYDTDDERQDPDTQDVDDDDPSPHIHFQSERVPVPPIGSNGQIENAIVSGNGEIDSITKLQAEYDDNDDHFFPFFLTAVILVIVIYVLYHNKSKVSKVVLGLIVEGRQSRRRNSRGHAYRRLDTLEQAMNTSGVAPPSKIIY